MMMVIYTILAIIVYMLIKKDERLHASGYEEKCISCGEKVQRQFLYCPFCQEALKRKCDKCSRLIEADWRYCPFCGDIDQ